MLFRSEGESCEGRVGGEDRLDFIEAEVKLNCGSCVDKVSGRDFEDIDDWRDG